MTIRELVDGLLSLGLSMNSHVCVGNDTIPLHIVAVTEDGGNTGIAVLRTGDKLREREVGYRV